MPRKNTIPPSYQVATTIGELIEALKKCDPRSPWTTDRLDSFFSVTVYDKDGNNGGMIVNKAG